MPHNSAITFTLAFLAATATGLARGEILSIDDFMPAESEMKSDSRTPDNPFEDVLSSEDDATRAVPPTKASADSAPSVYVIVAGSNRGDTAYRMDYSAGATVGSVLKKAVYPDPIDFKSTEIAVHRPSHHVTDELTVEAEERVLRVEWDAEKGQPTDMTNYPLQANDRIILKLPATSGPLLQSYQPAPIAADATQATYTLEPTIEVLPNVVAGGQYYAPEEPQAVVYSALPAAVPSPFTGDATVIVSPALAPAARVAADSSSPNPTQVQFNIAVVEDLDDSFDEFDQLQSPMPFMLADTATIRGTLRILEKHKLVRCISSPKLIATTGKEAKLQVGGTSLDPDQPWQGIKTSVSARELGGGLAVDFSFENTIGRQTNEVQASLAVAHGQSVVMKMGGKGAKTLTTEDESEEQVEPAVYLVLTPEILK
jgi:hypothetical protein